MLETQENYQKRSFRNRVYLCGPQGRKLSTIPLEKGKNEQLGIKEVKIANSEPWAEQFKRQVKSNYGSAPFFEYLYDDIDRILNREFIFLFDLNLAFLELIKTHLQADFDIDFTTNYKKDITDQDWLDVRNQFAPSTSFWDQEAIYYQQIFEDQHGFVKNLSILDMLMCRGPESGLILRSHAKNMIHEA